MPNFSLICPSISFWQPKKNSYICGYEKPHPLAHRHVGNNIHPGTSENLPNFCLIHWSFNYLLAMK